MAETGAKELFACERASDDSGQVSVRGIRRAPLRRAGRPVQGKGGQGIRPRGRRSSENRTRDDRCELGDVDGRRVSVLPSKRAREHRISRTWPLHRRLLAPDDGIQAEARGAPWLQLAHARRGGKACDAARRVRFELLEIVRSCATGDRDRRPGLSVPIWKKSASARFVRRAFDRGAPRQDERAGPDG